MRRSPPWATSLNPFSTTVGRPVPNDQKTASPLPLLSKLSENDVAAAVDGFEVPQDLLQWSHGRAQPVANEHNVNDHHTERASKSGAGHASSGGMSQDQTHPVLGTQSTAVNGDQQRGPRVFTTIVSNGRRTSKTDCVSMQNALELANRVEPGSLLHARAGVHSWEGDLLVQASNCNITAGNTTKQSKLLRGR